MRIPVWKKWISYVLPVTLETASSAQNPELAVMLDRGRLQLLSGNAIYSWDDLYHNFTIAFGSLDIEERPFSDVLVLGLGLGSVPFILEKLYEQQYHYTAVEWDETVAGLAAKYTFSRLDSPVDIITADAEVFIQVTEEMFDMVIVDIFEDDRTPDQFETTEFLQACAERLNPKGLLLYNRLHNSARNQVVTERFYEDVFKKVFPQAWMIDTGGNWVLISQP
ncbi:MAG: fused MFS/spermidine synthase [Saprospiraceae bacterium]|nr:fused MFS/spermidine synthase [Saprospiraceae bacterium]